MTDYGLCPICSNELVPHEDEDHVFVVGGIAPDTLDGVYCPTCDCENDTIDMGEFTGSDPLCPHCDGEGCEFCCNVETPDDICPECGGDLSICGHEDIIRAHDHNDDD